MVVVNYFDGFPFFSDESWNSFRAAQHSLEFNFRIMRGESHWFIKFRAFKEAQLHFPYNYSP